MTIPASGAAAPAPAIPATGGPLTGRDAAGAVVAALKARNGRTPDTAATFDPRALRRRRRAANRLPPFDDDGRRDTLDPPRLERDNPRPQEVDSYAVATAHLRRADLPALPPARVRQAMGEDPRRYAAVLPRRPKG